MAVNRLHFKEVAKGELCMKTKYALCTALVFLLGTCAVGQQVSVNYNPVSYTHLTLPTILLV